MSQLLHSTGQRINTLLGWAAVGGCPILSHPILSRPVPSLRRDRLAVGQQPWPGSWVDNQRSTSHPAWRSPKSCRGPGQCALTALCSWNPWWTRAWWPRLWLLISWHQGKGLCFIRPQEALRLLMQLAFKSVSSVWRSQSPIWLYKSKGLTTKAARHSCNEHLSATQNVLGRYIHQMFIDLSFGHFTGLEIITSDLNSV